MLTPSPDRFPCVFFRGTNRVAASAASRATWGNTDVYVSAVILIDECRSVAEMTFMSAPAATPKRVLQVVAGLLRRKAVRRPAVRAGRAALIG